MKKSIIWNISNGVEFPVELWKHPKLAILINNVPLKEFKSIELNPQEINLFFISAKQEEWSPIEYEFIKMFGSRSEISLLLLSQVGNTPIQINTANKGNLELLESPIRKKELKLIMEKTIQAEFYKTSAVEIGSGCLQNVGFFEGLFELAHAEYKNSQDIIHAFEKMLEYESKIKSYNNEVSQAIMRVNEMREAE
ncbi:MAG TPA: hypothetical protein PKC66_21130, partial [Leptospiraceae bacterium]|nr:hypothetical protein [Leptospiraceae bacterium]